MLLKYKNKLTVIFRNALVFVLESILKIYLT